VSLYVAPFLKRSEILVRLVENRRL